MKDLIEALTILLKYMADPDNHYPTACEHDVLYVWGVDIAKVPVEDVRKLDELGFIPGFDDCDYETIEETLGHDFAITGSFKEMTAEQWDSVKERLSDCFHSFKYGSC